MNGPTDGLKLAARVLIAEDNVDVARMLNALLDAEDDIQCVGTVSSAAAIVPALRGCSANVLLLDMGLKDASGMTVMADCRSQFPELVVIVLSGHSQPELMREARAQGATDYLVKPDDMDNLAARIRAAVSE